MSCTICKGLEESGESRLSEYVKARAAVYYRVSTELAAYKNVEMERAKSELEEHRLLCVCASKSSQSGPNHLGKPKECAWQRSEAIRTGESRN
jgi:Zn-dependent peptidase ImmA (M78 family)